VVNIARAWRRIHKEDVEGYERAEKAMRANRAAIDPHHPKAPKSKPLGKQKTALPARIVAMANESLRFAGHMTYTETAARSELFHRKPGDFNGAHADCSQLVASILHWLGVTTVTATDYTGTLIEKGKQIARPRPGCVAIWGPHTGAHAAFVTEKVGNDWMTVGFGHQGAPDRNLLSGMNIYFDSVGQPGVRFLWFAA
jgi:hypothetical protein